MKNEEIKEISLEERIEKLLESSWVNEFNYLENQLQEARCLVLKLNEERKKNLDYITNLQEENERKNAYIKYLEEYNPKYYKGKKFYGDGREDY